MDGIETLIRDELVVVRHDVNLGFGRACNKGAGVGVAELVLFLNPDACLRPDSLNPVIARLGKSENANVAVFGVKLIDSNGKIWRTCARLPSPTSMCVMTLGIDRLFPIKCPSYVMSEWDHATTRFVDHVIGAFYLIRRRAFESMRGFDEDYFVYLEDLDLSYRLCKAGWRSLYVAEATAYHAGGGSSQQIRARRLAYSVRSRLVFVRKHFQLGSRVLVSTLSLLVEPLIRLTVATCRADWATVKNTFGGYAMLYAALVPKTIGSGAK